MNDLFSDREGSTTQEGPNQTDNNLMGTDRYGWASLGTLRAGDRLVFSNEFLTDFMSNMQQKTKYWVGLKGNDWTNGSLSNGGHDFIGTGMRFTNTKDWKHSINTFPSSLSVEADSHNQWTNPVKNHLGAFIELSADGTTVRSGYYKLHRLEHDTDQEWAERIANNPLNEATTTYNDWHSDFKVATSNISPAITEVDIMFFGSNDFDGISVYDLSEVNFTKLVYKKMLFLDTDKDGISNHLDLDSDNDGCPDVREAGFTDNNFDGILDGSGIDADGKVTGDDGYTTPKNTENTTPADYINDLENECIPTTITFNDIHTVAYAPDNIELAATTTPNTNPITGNPFTINYTIQNPTTDTSLNGDKITVGAVGVSTVTATIAASGYFLEVAKNAKLYIDNDNDNDKVGDFIDVDDDNDGILDSEECNCTPENIISQKGFTLLGPDDNQTGANLFDERKFGWASSGGKLSAGKRLVFNTEFLTELKDAMPQKSRIYMGLKASDWSNENKPQETSKNGFAGDMYIFIRKNERNEIFLKVYKHNPGNPSVRYQTSTIPDHKDLTNDNLFIEVSTDGNSIRMGVSQESDDDAAETTYEDWTPSRKIESTITGLGTSALDIVFYGDDYAISGNIKSLDSGKVNWLSLTHTLFLDTDKDGIPNHFDLDSDGDGCFDVYEAGFTDAEFDGILDGTVDPTNGKVNGVDGYTTPKNTDNTTPADYINDGIYDCMPTINFNDIYKLEYADDFTLQATTNSGGTITYTLETNTTGTSLSGDTVTVGSEDTLIVTATVSQSGSYAEASKEITLHVQKDTDGDKIADADDEDDDNDGILDTVECNCIFNKATGTVTGSGSGYTLKGPAANQTTPDELYNVNSHGWMSLNEKLAPGGRLILNAAFFEELSANMGEQAYVYIGIRGNGWNDFIDQPSSYSGFKNRTFIEIWKSTNTNRLYFRLQADNAATSRESLWMWQSPEAFIELSNDGKHIRLGLTSNGPDDVTTTTYDEWDADRKIQGTTSDWRYRVKDPIDIMFLGKNKSTDVGSIDWSTIQINGAETPDTDSDGIFNHLDLDSDG